MEETDFLSSDTYKFLVKINSYLWKNKNLGNVSLMIGAGFSKNSFSLSDNSRMPDWEELGRKILSRLYPETSESRQMLKKLAKQYSGSNGAVELAGEFAELYGESELNKIIEEEIKDHHFLPTELHKEVFKFPWADIFTTNYDTLLEKALTDSIGRRYEIIKKIGDIPNSVQPRIFKLHGSISDSTPYIITEEQYRTYPDRFAPFVNSVQQSMMENILCLIGFSGKDPNFIKWTGWIKDNLKENSPKVYLVGIFDELTTSQKLLLKRRNVEVVNMLDVPEIKKGQHKEAIQFFFNFLESNKKVSPRDWPRVIENKNMPFPTLNKLLKMDIKRHKISPSQNRAFTSEDFEKITIKWRLEREECFSWPHLHNDIRCKIYRDTSTNIHELFNSLKNADKSFCMELAWRLNKANFHVFENWYNILQGFISNSPQAQDQELLKFLISDDRFCKNQKNHDRHLEQLCNISDDEVYTAYLKLRDLTENGQYKKAHAIIKDLIKAHHSTETYLIVSWFYYQIDLFEEASHYSKLALNNIRAVLSLQKDDAPYFLYLENIAKYQLFYITQKLGNWANFKDYQPSTVSKEVLADLTDIRDQLESSLRESIENLKKDHEEVTGFDVGSSSVTHHSSDFFSYEKSHFYSLYQMCVNSYLQLSFISKDLIIKVINFSYSYNEMSSLNLITNAKNRDVTKATLSKIVVITLQQKTINHWTQNLMVRVNEIISLIKESKKVNFFNSTLYSDLHNSLEILSRLSLRMSSDQRLNLFKYIYRELQIKQIQESFNTIDVINDLLRRITGQMPPKEIQEVLALVCNLPTFDEDFIQNQRREFIDPIYYIFESKPIITKDQKIEKAISDLLKRAREKSPNNLNVLIRIHYLYINNLLTTDQVGLFRNLLWDNISFPKKINNFFAEDDNFHLLIYTPNPSGIDTIDYIKKEIIKLKPKAIINEKTPEEDIKRVPIGSGIGRIKYYDLILSSSNNLHSDPERTYIDWDTKELTDIVKTSLSLWKNERKLLDFRRTNSIFSTERLFERRYYNIPHILATNIIPFISDQSILKDVKTLSVELEKYQIPCSILQPSLFFHGLISLEELEEKISENLASFSHLHQNDAFLAIYQWAALGKHFNRDKISENTMNEVFLFFYRTASTLSYDGYNMLFKIFKLDNSLYSMFGLKTFKIFQGIYQSTKLKQTTRLTFFTKSEIQTFDIQFANAHSISKVSKKMINLSFVKNSPDCVDKWSRLISDF
ncbi:MAG: SIR2 family protein [Bdellovibrionota bacterium]|nr:SIR2 family protein [Bdellovibrionota bacterium]